MGVDVGVGGEVGEVFLCRGCWLVWEDYGKGGGVVVGELGARLIVDF